METGVSKDEDGSGRSDSRRQQKGEKENDNQCFTFALFIRQVIIDCSNQEKKRKRKKRLISIDFLTRKLRPRGRLLLVFPLRRWRADKPDV
jgi:hypothetical protein